MIPDYYVIYLLGKYPYARGSKTICHITQDKDEHDKEYENWKNGYDNSKSGYYYHDGDVWTARSLVWNGKKEKL